MLDIKVLGPGCMNCTKLANMCGEVANENNIKIQLEKITNVDKFMDYGVMLTPALIVNNKLLLSGKMPTKSTLAHWLIEEFKNLK